MACNTTPYNHGVICAKAGYSIHYNPYRHKGTAQQFADWGRGWESVGNNKTGAE